MSQDLDNYRALPAEERERMGFARYCEETRVGTHNEECWTYGPRHYECAVREIERLLGAIRLCNPLGQGEPK